MILLILLTFALVIIVELINWPRRSFKEYFIYITMMLAVTTLAVLLIINPQLPAPDINKFLDHLLEKLWGGG